MKSVCIFCGANFNGDPILKEVVEQLAEVLVNRNMDLVYGGGKVGVMGLIADAVLRRGGRVTGVIPQFLMQKEVGHDSISEMHVVQTMHERKQLMSNLSDAFIMLPGGFGTLEEFFEVLTWLQLGLHQKPIGVLNVNGFYDLLLKQMDVMVEEQFLKPANRSLVLTSVDPVELIDLMEQHKPKAEEVWFRNENLT